jgi:hypothetical protein
LEKVKLSHFVGESLEEEFLNFDLTEIQKVLKTLQETEAIDIAHAELLQQQALRGADILIEYLGKIVKTIGYLEARVSSVKNKAALDYKDPNGGKVTVEMRKWASEISADVEDVQIKLAKAKASKMVLEKKYDILIKLHHYNKEIASGLKKTILGYSPLQTQTVEGWE